MARRKRWDSYEDFLQSEEWKSIKSKFFNEYNGYHNACQITGDAFNDEEKHRLHLHHWRYPKNWEDTTTDDLILVCDKVHEFIHGDDHVNYCNLDSAKSKEQYLTEASIGYWGKQLDLADVERFNAVERWIKNYARATSEVREIKKRLTRKDKIIDELLSTIESLRKEKEESK